MRFSAMLAEEYILIVPFAYQLHIGLNELISAKEYNFNFSFLLASVPAEESQNISTAESRQRCQQPY
jgi:hypothetical protein